MIRLIIAGPRDYEDKEKVWKEIDSIIAYLRTKHRFTIKSIQDNIEIVQGGARGVDFLAKRYAYNNEYKQKEFKADWEKYGRGAGPKRNKDMAEYGDVLLAFYNGSKGTSNMIKTAIDNGLDVFIIKI